MSQLLLIFFLLCRFINPDPSSFKGGLNFYAYANRNPVRVSGYGPVLGYQASTLTANTLLADTLVWRSRTMDPGGFYCLGARYYDPIAGHFLSADPLGHASSMDLYSFCNGDPLNKFDPTGRFSKQNADSFSQAGDSSFDSRNINFGSTWFDQLQYQSRGGDLVSSYNHPFLHISQQATLNFLTFQKRPLTGM